MTMLLKNIDLNFYPSIPGNYKASQDGQICIPAGPTTYILTNSILNSGLVSNPPVPSKFKPGDENKIDYRREENRADWKAYNGDDDEDEENEDGDTEVEEDAEVDGIEGDVEEDKARPEFQFHWQKLETTQDEGAGEVMKGGVAFQLDQSFKEGWARQLEWSPLGAGKHRRCSLTILTTSRQVLIYQQATIIGRGLKFQMRLLDRLIDQDNPGNETVEISWDKLPREICWSYPCTFLPQRWGISIFTMVDENNSLTFVHINDEDVRTLLKSTVELPEGSRMSNMCWSPWINISAMEGISFFGYKTQEGLHLQKMVLLKNDEGDVALSCDGDPVLVSTGMLPGYEPHAILWYDRLYNVPDQQPEILLAAIQHDGVELFGVTLDPSKNLAIQRQSKVELDLPARLSGYAFSDPLWMDYLDLNLCSNNSGLAIFRIDLADLTKSIVYKASIPTFRGRTLIQNDPEFVPPNPYRMDFIDVLDKKRETFVNNWKIMQASCQVFGMAYCPLGGILTVCYRLKPEGVLEYPIKERERCTLSWDFCRHWSDMFDGSKSEGSVKPFTLFEVPAEAFVSDIRFLVDPEEAEGSFGKMEEMVRKEENANPAPAAPAQGPGVVLSHKLGNMPISELSNHISFALFNSTEAITRRARNLLGLLKVNRIAPKKPGLLVAQTEITKLVLTEILEIPLVKGSPLFECSKTSLTVIYLLASLGIIAFYRDKRIFELSTNVIETLEGSFGIDMTAEKKVIEERNAVIADPGNLDLLVSMKKKMGRGEALEKCGICGGNVHFDDLMNGRCERGHLFKRCALTFALITDANSRVCGICSREYISRKMVEGDEKTGKASSGEEGSMKIEQTLALTLLRVLFEAVDTCVFCGGTFYDKEEYRRSGGHS